MKRVALYPGTFDPITNGHLDIVKRARTIFDEVIIAVAVSQEKKPMFDLKRRAQMAKIATKDFDGVRIETFGTLLVDFANKIDVNVIIRGLRAVSDFEYELQMGYANASLDPNIETIYLMPSLDNAFISSSVVRSILKHKGNVSHLVPNIILPFLDENANVLDI